MAVAAEPSARWSPLRTDQERSVAAEPPAHPDPAVAAEPPARRNPMHPDPAVAAEPPARRSPMHPDPAVAAEPPAQGNPERAVAAEPPASRRAKPKTVKRKPAASRAGVEPGPAAKRRRTTSSPSCPLPPLKDPSDEFDLQAWLRDLLGAAGYARNPRHSTLKLVTGCSGTGSPTVVARSLLGHDCVDELFASERNPAAALFLIRSCRPAHVFKDMRDAVESPAAPCFVHAGQACRVPTHAEDLFVCGFVCKDNSPQNPARFKQDPVKDKGVSDHMDTFYASVEHINQRQPRVALLENVWHGLVMTRGTPGAGSVLDFLLKDAKWGLENINNYTTAVVHLRGTDGSIPMLRARCFFLLVRTDAGISAQRVVEIHKTLMEGVKPGIHHAKSFVLPANDAIVRDWLAKPTKGDGQALDGGLEACATESKYSVAVAKAFKKAISAKRLPVGWQLTPLASRPSTVHALTALPPFMRGNVDVYSDILKHMVAQRTADSSASYRLADVSQTVSRGRATVDGTVPTLTTSSRIFDYEAGRFWTPSELLAVHGFPVDINTGGLAWSEVTALAGNGMILPVVGSIVAAILVALDFYTQVPSAA